MFQKQECADYWSFDSWSNPDGLEFVSSSNTHVLESHENFQKKIKVMLCHFRFAVIFEWSRDVLPVLCSAGIGGIVTNTSSAVLECSKIFLFSPPASCIFLIRRHKQKIIHTLNMVQNRGLTKRGKLKKQDYHHIDFSSLISTLKVILSHII